MKERKVEGSNQPFGLGRIAKMNFASCTSEKLKWRGQINVGKQKQPDAANGYSEKQKSSVAQQVFAS